jgi:hypothetical protein
MAVNGKRGRIYPDRIGICQLHLGAIAGIIKVKNKKNGVNTNEDLSLAFRLKKNKRAAAACAAGGPLCFRKWGYP